MQDPARAQGLRAAFWCAWTLSVLVIGASTVLGAFAEETQHNPLLGFAEGLFAAGVLLPVTAVVSVVVGCTVWWWAGRGSGGSS